MLALEIKKLQENRAAKITEMDTLIADAKKEERSLTDEQKTQWNDLETEVNTLDEDITRLERQDTLNARSAKKVSTPNIQGLSSNKPFSITKALRQYVEGDLDGVEAEVHQEGKKELRDIGLNGGVGLHLSSNPDVYTRDLDVTGADEFQGFHTVPTIKPSTLIDALVNATVLNKVGVKKMMGLTGNIELNKEKTAPSAYWEGETDPTDLSGIKFDKIPLAPRRLSSKEYISYQLLIQSSISMDTIVTQKIVQAFARAIDEDGLSKVLEVAEFYDGGDGGDSWKSVVGLRDAVLTKNVVSDGCSYVTTQGVKGIFDTTPKDAGSGIMLTDALGYPLEVTNSLVGAGTAGGDPCIFGQFNNLILAQWGGLILTPDAITMADTGQWKITVNGYFDSQVEYDEAFAYMNVTSA